MKIICTVRGHYAVAYSRKGLKSLIKEGEILTKIALAFSIGVMVLLYLIGFIAEIDFLVFEISSSKTEIALLPIIVGLFVALISDYIIKYKARKN